ncbi:MAG: aldo/keto reductase [Candidatus Thermoplasmatota archaeon]|nr:aldo/keto reductase [Candidatus Thermoplasmatota archaeon]
MEQIELGGSGIKVSQVGLGMWQAGGPEWGEDVNDDDCVAAMVRAHELGVNLIDTAEVYGDGHSEEVVGRAIKEIGRDEVVIATKVSGGHLRYGDVQKACERSLKRLGVDVIDLYQIHWPDPWQQVPLEETMKAMEKLHKQGKIRAVAVSNFAVRDMVEAREALSDTDIVSNQVQYNMLHREIEKQVLPFCQKEGIAIIAWGPLAEGSLTGKYGEEHRPQDPLRKDHRFFTDKNMKTISGLLSVLEAVGKSHGKTTSQVALNWLLSKENVIPIPGAKRPSHMESNVGAAGWSLSPDEMSRVEAAVDAVRIDPFRT